jgi:glycosyltransferase involved in cell wall biosynthesis
MFSTAEGFGIVFLEAMDTGIPVICVNRDGSLDAVADGVLGFAVDPENKEELVAGICTALRGPQLQANCSKRFDGKFFTEHLKPLLEYRNPPPPWSDGAAPR